MTNYEQDTLNLINGETPRAKYDQMVKVNNLIEMIANPRRGRPEEHWGIYDVVDYILTNGLLPENSKY